MWGRPTKKTKAKKSVPVRFESYRTLTQSWILLIALVSGLAPSPLSAATAVKSATTIGDVFCNLHANAGAFPYILNVICYVAGLFLIVAGVLGLRKHFEGAQNALVVSLAKLVAGAFFTALPMFAGVLQKSVMGTIGSSGAFSCSAAAPSTTATSLDVIIANFVKNLHSPMMNFLGGISICIGLLYIARGIMKASKSGSGQNGTSPKDIAANFVIGAILISASKILDVSTYSILGTTSVASMSSFSGINWSKISSSTSSFTEADNAVKAILAFLQIIGLIAFIRGWMIIKAVGEGAGQATIAQGATHIIGGTLCINIDKTLKIMDTTFGTGLVL